MPKVHVYGVKPNRRRANLRGKLRKNHQHKTHIVKNNRGQNVVKCIICKYHIKSPFLKV